MPEPNRGHRLVNAALTALTVVILVFIVLGLAVNYHP